MPAVAVEGTDPAKLALVQQCLHCQKIGRNRTAPDDDQTAIWQLINSFTTGRDVL